MSDGKLTKLQIFAFKDSKAAKKEDDAKSFALPINPESFSRNLKAEQEKSGSQGSQGTNPKYTKHAPEEIKLDFYLDATGTVEGYVEALKKLSVPKQIDLFLKTVYFMRGEQHKPAILKLSWGAWVFDCVLTNLDINYTLFQSNGDPLRAKLSATFLQFIHPDKRIAQQDKRSPDLTHVKYIQEDSLPQMSFDLYGDPKYYLHLAKVNNLTSFRNIESGSQLNFPPFRQKSN